MSKKKEENKTSIPIEALAVCKKDLSGKVLMQNLKCENICGSRIGKICSDNCMDLYAKANIRDSKGTFQFKNVKIEQDDYDILMVNDGESILSLLYNLSEKKKEDTSFFKKFDLTPSELKIIGLVGQGLSNSEISDQISISPKTLKTHINNILKKIPRDHWPR